MAVSATGFIGQAHQTSNRPAGIRVMEFSPVVELGLDEKGVCVGGIVLNMETGQYQLRCCFFIASDVIKFSLENSIATLEAILWHISPSGVVDKEMYLSCLHLYLPRPRCFVNQRKSITIGITVFLYL